MQRVVRKMESINLTLLDKLTSIDDVEGVSEATEEQYLRSIVRDVYHLLSCKRYLLMASNTYSDVENSILNYGLDEYLGCSLKDGAMIEKMCNEIRWTIDRFEPRLKNIVVKPIESLDKGIVFAFDIRAQVNMDNDINIFQLRLALNTANRLLSMEGE
jgi:type VI secretion system protein ImpF